MNKFRNVLLALALCLVALFSAGCSTITVSQTTTSNSVATYQITFEILKGDMNALQQSNGYSVTKYFNDLCAVSGMVGQVVEGEDCYVFVSAINADPNWLGADATKTVQDGLFFKTVKVSMKNPLVVLYEKYKNNTITLKPGTAESVIYYMLNGKTENGKVVLQPITEIFAPYVTKDTFDGVVLEYLLQRRWGMSTEQGKTDLLLYGDSYCFSVVAGEDGMVEYTYLAPIGWHWYALAVVLGVLVAIVLLLSSRAQAKKVGALEDCRKIEKLRLMKSYSDKAGVPFSMDNLKKANNVVVFEEDQVGVDEQQDEQVDGVDEQQSEQVNESNQQNETDQRDQLDENE